MRFSVPRRSIYEIGEHDGAPYIAMEYVEGQTLGAWARAARRSWSEALAVMVDAGRGLAAAHAKGLIHRDFKPDNVMVDGEGRVRVMDFGLVHGEVVDEPRAASAHPPSRSSRSRATPPSAFGNHLTATGSTLGTPAYMSPEQHTGHGIDARSDQFSFCVTLWELVHGQRPFCGATLAQLYLAVSSGEPVEPPAGADVPVWLRKVMERGLAADPARRWASMDELLAALADDPSRRRKFLIGLGGVLVLALAGFGLRGIQLERQRAQLLDACAEDGRALADTWTEDDARALEAGFLASGQPFAADSWSRTRAGLDAYASAWAQLREQTCVEARLDGTRDAGELAQIQACLDDASSAFGVTLEVLAAADARLVAHAPELPQTLPRLDRCTDAALLAREFAALVEGGARDGHRDLRRELQRADARMIIGDFAGARPLVDRALEQAASLEHRDLEARAWLARARLHDQLGDHEDARDAYERAFMIAGQVGADDLALRAATALCFVVGDQLGRNELGLQWGRVAQMFVARLGLEDSADAGQVHANLAHVSYDTGDYDAALEHGERALALFEAALGPEHPMVAGALLEIAGVHEMRDGSARALALGERALAIYEAAYGPHHPMVAGMLVNVGIFLEGLGRLDDARANYQRSLEIRERAFGPDNVLVSRSLDALAFVAYAEGRLAEGLTLLERSLAIREAALGPNHVRLASTLAKVAIMRAGLGDDQAAFEANARSIAILEAALGRDHVDVAAALVNHGQYLLGLGRFDEAEATLQRALAIYEAKLGPDHTESGRVVAGLGTVLEERGDLRGAVAEYRRSLEIFEAVVGPEHYELCVPLYLMGHAYAQLGEHEAARDALERTLALDLAAVGPNMRAADTRGELIEIYEALGEREQARRHAEAARDELRGLGADDEAAKYEAWLAGQ